MSKRKILVLALTIAMAAILAIGGTLAYFTDMDADTNVFTVGNVKIEQIEKQRKEDEDGEKTTELEDFEQNKKLLPIVGSAQGEKDELGLPTAENYVDKIVTVKNNGTEAAWVRTYFAIPSALDDGYDTFNAGMNVLHFNFGSKMVDGKAVTTQGNEWTWKQANGKWNYFETTIDGIAYNVYFADYYQPLEANATTEQFVQGVYLDKSFDYDAEAGYSAFGKALTVDAAWDWNSVKCPVKTVAVQAAGFADANAAVTEAFGAQYNPWGGTVTNWQ